MGLCDAGLGQIDARDLKPFTSKEDGVPALSFGQAQYVATRNAVHVLPQETVGLGAVEVAVGTEALLPGSVRRRRVR
jgi:hypothetical protein